MRKLLFILLAATSTSAMAKTVNPIDYVIGSTEGFNGSSTMELFVTKSGKVNTDFWVKVSEKYTTFDNQNIDKTYIKSFEVDRFTEVAKSTRKVRDWRKSVLLNEGAQTICDAPNESIRRGRRALTLVTAACGTSDLNIAKTKTVEARELLSNLMNETKTSPDMSEDNSAPVVTLPVEPNIEPVSVIAIDPPASTLTGVQTESDPVAPFAELPTTENTTRKHVYERVY